MKLGGKHAKELGYLKFVGEEINVTGKTFGRNLVEVKIEVQDIPFLVSIAVHKEDVLYT